MEPVFTKLVDQFITGKLSRRDLIQSLAAASAVAVGTGTAQAATGRQLNAATVNHISYQCKDYGKLRDFYAQNFGMKVSHDFGKQAYLQFGDTILIVRNAASGPTPLIDHIAYTVKGYGPKGGDPAKFKADNDAVKAELEARGFKPEPETEMSWAVRDPEGYKVQVCPEIMTPGDPMFERVVSGLGQRPPQPK